VASIQKEGEKIKNILQN